MADLNYFNGVVRILEVPREKILNDKFSILKCRVQLPQTKSTRVVTLNVWSRLAKDLLKSYNVNDYILIEGYLSLKVQLKKKLSTKTSKIFKKVEINSVKIYPYVLNSNK